jgi:hypothetical protein
MRQIIENQERKLDKLLSDISTIQDDELKAHLSKYFCVRISGYLENVFKILVANYSEGSSQKPVTNYLQNDLKNITNLSEEKIQRTLIKFSDDWYNIFNSKVSEQQLQSLNSIISNRNSIAHGQQDNISYKVIGQYYTDLKVIVEALKDTIKK